MHPFTTRLVLYCCICMFPLLATAQEKGLSPAEQSVIRSTGRTRALVIGVSDYQYIDKLDYAHRDAESFASFLYDQQISRSDVVVLTNEKATHGNVTTELMRLAGLSEPGDNFIFYFSGHGDVEKRFKMAYLLLHDSYKNNYMAGTLCIDHLRNIFVTLCSEQVKVTVVTDACRAGNLAGGKDGRQFTAAQLKPIWSNEIKILSSEPDQLSIEGPQWGGGRGVFSWYLLSGMEGSADANSDSLITINELNQYVGTKVSEVTGGKQQPIIDGPNRFSTVIVNLKKTGGKGKAQTGNFALYKSTYWLPMDSCSVLLEKMQSAIAKKDFSRDGTSAIDYYEKIRQCTNDREVVLTANSNLLSAMLNEAQEIVNNSFSGKKMISVDDCRYARELFASVLEFNDLRLPYGNSLSNLQRYLRVLESVMSWKQNDYQLMTRIVDSAIAREPEASYLTMAKGLVELRFGNYTRATELLENATVLGPGWLIPKFYLGVAYGYKREYRKALQYYEEVLASDSTFKTFECADCIEAKMKQYEKRVSRIKFEKFGSERHLGELEMMRTQLADNIDSAYFFHEMGLVSNRKNHPKRDSVFHFLTQAFVLDPWEPEYMYSLNDYLYRELYGFQEIRYWTMKFLEKAEEGEMEDEIKYFKKQLLYSYIATKEFSKAAEIAGYLVDRGYFDCGDLRKLEKRLGREPLFKQLRADCP